MGCTSSNLNRRHSSHKRISKSVSHSQRQAISVVGILLHKGYSVHVVQSESNNISDSLRKDEEHKFLGKGKLAGGRDGEGASDELSEILNSNDFSLGSKEGEFFSQIRFLESPQKLCTEQERRLRCANLEGPASGLTDLSSDEDDDEGDGFEFAKLEGSIASFNSEPGHIWTPITSFNSEQGTKKIPSLGAILDSPDGEEVLATGKLGSGSWDMPQDSSISEPEFQILISPDYTDLPLSDSENQSAPLSPQSACSAEVPSCSPLLERFPSDSLDQLTRGSSTSQDSLFFPGFKTQTDFECGSISPSSASFTESIMAFSPSNDACWGGPSSMGTNMWIHSLPSWRYHSFSDGTQEELEAYRPSRAVHGSRWGHPSPSPAKSLHVHDDSSICEALIPGLPNDLAQLCLMRIPFIKYNPSFRMVCRQWRAVLSSEEFFKTRNALGVHEAHISFVVHGNRVQIFSLQTHEWFCLPPLPREGGILLSGWRTSPDWGQSPDSQSSPEPCRAVSDWGIDPYDWWQIDTVAVSEGNLFVIGGDQAEIHSLTRPSKPTNRVHKYDFCRNCWIAVSPMQVPRSHGAAVSLGKFLYVAGGSEDIEEGASAEVYDCEQDKWTMIPSMNTSMRMCVGMDHGSNLYVKGENMGPGTHVAGEVFRPTEGRWDRMSPGMRKGLERGPMASCGSDLFVADWKDSLLKVYDFKADLWSVVTKLPARISRLVGHSTQLYALTGKIKVDPYNHHIISDAPAEVWKLDLGSLMKAVGRLCEGEDGYGSCVDLCNLADAEGVLEKLNDMCEWDCVWRDPKQMIKTGGLAWVPCIAHCTVFED